MKIYVISAMLFAGVAIVGVSSPVSAATDLKSFSSMTCRPNGPASLDVITYSYQGVFNTSTTNNAVIICPLEKDADGDTSATAQALYVVAKAPASSTASANCTVQVGSLSSGSASSSAATGTIAAGSSSTMSLDARTESTWTYEPINLVCSLSPRTRLTRIYLFEDGVTNSP